MTGRGEDAVLVVELQVSYIHSVERVDHGVDQLGIVAQALLDEAGQRREHQGAVDALLVHELEPGGGLAEGRRVDFIGLPKISRRLLPSGLPVSEVVLLRARAGTTSKVGLGMYSLIWPLTTILVRPSTST